MNRDAKQRCRPGSAEPYTNLQIGDNDLVGNKFNGHDLHLLLQQQGVRSYHYVAIKRSDDATTFSIATSPEKDFARQSMLGKEFLLSDIVHLHLIHNTDFDINLLPLMTSLKPTVITLHDPFFLTGHCIHFDFCDKWKTCCKDCGRLDAPFALTQDISALLFEEKRVAFQNADISLIVASEWMRERVMQSPIMRGKAVYLLPFGVDQAIFTPADTAQAKRALGIDPAQTVLMFRAQEHFKGVDIIRDALQMLESKNKISLIIVNQQGLFDRFESRYDIHEYGWVTDDAKLAQLYQACDIFLMPSTQEAFGVMAVEAMSCGKPVLSILGTALPDVIHSPECGLAVERDEYAAVLQRWIDNEDERRVRGERSLAYARERYSLTRYVQGMLDIYDDVMDRFVPGENAETVIRQLSALDASPENEAPPLYLSRSWRITKPIRAFQTARKLSGAGVAERISAYRTYMQDDIQDMQSNYDILRSNCWRITAPLRLASQVLRGRR